MMFDMALQDIATSDRYQALGSGVGRQCRGSGPCLPSCIATSTDMAGILTLRIMGLEVSVEMLLAIEHLVTSWNSASHALYHRLGDCCLRYRIHRSRARWARDSD